MGGKPSNHKVPKLNMKHDDRISNSGLNKDLGINSNFLNLNVYLLFIFGFPIATSLRLRTTVTCVSEDSIYMYILA